MGYFFLRFLRDFFCKQRRFVRTSAYFFLRSEKSRDRLEIAVLVVGLYNKRASRFAIRCQGSWGGQSRHRLAAPCARVRATCRYTQLAPCCMATVRLALSMTMSSSGVRAINFAKFLVPGESSKFLLKNPEIYSCPNLHAKALSRGMIMTPLLQQAHRGVSALSRSTMPSVCSECQQSGEWRDGSPHALICCELCITVTLYTCIVAPHLHSWKRMAGFVMIVI
jgi:hypothetical protein